MLTAETHKAVKTSSSKDGWGMSHSTWDYRGVSLRYTQRTVRRAPWAVHVDDKKDWWSLIGHTKTEMMADVDRYLDELGYTAQGGKLRHPER
jgi:hypothetical protein